MNQKPSSERIVKDIRRATHPTVRRRCRARACGWL